MAEEVSIIHEHALFFDDILNCIPASMYLQPTAVETEQWKNGFKKNNNAAKIRELKENAQKRRRERFDPSYDVPMADKIAERKKQLEEEVDAEIRVAVPLTPTTPAKSLDELRERLREKIEMLRKNRVEKESQKKQQQQQPNRKRMQKKEPEPEPEPAKKPKVEKEPVVDATPTVNDVISNIQFGKIKVAEEVDTSLKPKPHKDIHKLLKQAQKKQDYLKKLKSTEAGKKEAENIEWEDVMSKAEGFRKKDNPALIKKTIKRQDAKKKKSREEWAQRKQAEKKRNRPGFEGKKRGFLNEKKGGKNEKKA